MRRLDGEVAARVSLMEAFVPFGAEADFARGRW
jgi:hypothetical protein